MYRRIFAQRRIPQTLAATALASFATYQLLPPRTLRLDSNQSTTETIKEKASDAANAVKDAFKDRHPLKPESPAGVAGAKTSVNPNTSMNHGQSSMGGVQAPHDLSVVASADKKRQEASGNPSVNEASGDAKEGGGTGAKIASGHGDDGKPNADLQAHADAPAEGERKKKKKKKSKKAASDSPSSPAGDAARAGSAAGAGLTSTVAEGMQEKEQEASQEQAFNEETGEINWDCPCLGGMAHGPCGETFKAAFSCFVYSKEEPKGKECLDKFRGMQECFREHPEIYGNLVDDDETPEGKVIQEEK
jgi:hypothetical protein